MFYAEASNEYENFTDALTTLLEPRACPALRGSKGLNKNNTAILTDNMALRNF